MAVDSLLARPTAESQSGIMTAQISSGMAGGGKSQNVAGTRFGIGTFRVGGAGAGHNGGGIGGERNVTQHGREPFDGRIDVR